MKHIKILTLLVLIIASSTLYAGNKTVTVSGTIYEKVNDSYIPLSLANVHCLGTIEGTISSALGDFKMNLKEGRYQLVFSYVGYDKITKVIEIKKRKNNEMYLEIVLEKEKETRLAEN